MMIQNSMEKVKNLKVNRWGIIFFIALLFFTYLPIFIIEFGIHNDYSAWAYDNSKCCLGYPESTHLLALGRPLGAYLLNIQFLFFDQVVDFGTARFVSFLFILASAGLSYYYLTRRLSLDKRWGLALLFCIFTLPSSQVYIIWVTNFAPGSFNVFLACLSYLMLDQVWQNRSSPQKTVAKIGWTITASLIFLSSLLIYPPTSLFFLLFTLKNILFSKVSLWATTRLRVILDVLFCGSHMVAYFLLTRFVYFPLMSTYNATFREYFTAIRGPYEFSIADDLLGKLNLLYHITRTALNGWNTKLHTDFSTQVFWLFVLMIVVLTFFHFFTLQTSQNNRQPLKQKFGVVLQAVILCALLLIFSVSPLLIASGGFLAYRTIFPYSAMVVLIVFWLVNQITQLISETKREIVVNPLLLVITIIVAIFTQMNLLNTALWANIELNFIRHSLATADFSKVKNLVVVKPFEESVLTNINSSYEFYHMATNLTFISGVMDITLAELQVDQSGLHITPIDRANEQRLYIDRNLSHVINMNQARTFNLSQARPLSIVYVEASHPSNCCSLQLAFDQSEHKFWEYNDPLPIWGDIDFGDSPALITRYALSAYILPERMPKRWELLASNDGQNWTTLDQRVDQIEWDEFESRTFLIQTPSQFRYYQLVFQEGNSDIMRIGEISFFEDQDYQSPPLLVEEDYKSFNIVRYGVNYYILAQSLGIINLEELLAEHDSNEVEAFCMQIDKQCGIATSLEEARLFVDQLHQVEE